MAVGDVDVLERIERRDRRTNRYTRKLIRKLAKTKRNIKASSNYQVCTRSVFHSIAFTGHVGNGHNNETIRRRLLRARNAEGSRMFYVGDASETLDGPSVLVVAARTQVSSERAIARAVHKESTALPTSISAPVCLLMARTNETLALAGSEGVAISIRSVFLKQYGRVLYAECSACIPVGQPRVLGVDKSTFAALQVAVSRMIGAKIE